MTRAINKKTELMLLELVSDDSFFCPHCHNTLNFVAYNGRDEGLMYCPNDMCLNEAEYDVRGEEL